MKSELTHGLGISIASRVSSNHIDSQFIIVKPTVVGASVRVYPNEKCKDIWPSQGFTSRIAEECESFFVLEPAADRVFISRVNEESNLIIVNIPENSSCDIIDTIDVSGSRIGVSVIVNAGINSKVNYVCVQSSKSDLVIREIHLNADVGAQVNLRTFDIGSSILLSRTSLTLAERSVGNIVNAFCASGKQVMSLRSKSHIIGPSAKTNVVVRGIGSGQSLSVAKSMIRMESAAVGSDGLQREDVMLLEDGAEISTLPELEIETSDVSCSHGSTTGNLDPERIFYAQSRGVSYDDAVRLMLEGFFEDLLQDLPKEIREDARMRIKGAL